MPAKHTPGPWRIEPRIEHPNDHCEGIFGPHNEAIVITDSGVYPPTMADAQLIAAAPDLLAAVQSVVSWFQAIDREHHERTVIGQTLESASANWLLPSDVPSLDMAPLQAAIAKAEGR